MDKKEKIKKEIIENKNRGSLKEFFINLIYRILRDDISGIGAQLAYNMLLALIPLIFVFFRGVTIFFPEADRLFFSFLSFLPFGAESFVENVVDVITSQQGEGTFVMSILVSLYLASKGIRSIIMSVNQAFGLKEERKGIKIAITSLLYTVILIGIVILMLSLRLINRAYFQDFLDNTVFQFRAFELSVNTFKILLTQVFPYIVITLFLAFFYKTAPDTKRNQNVLFSEALVGGISGGIGAMILTEIYSYFMNNISSWNIYYGSFASIMAILVWFLFINYIIIIGAEVVACYIEVYKGKKLNK